MQYSKMKILSVSFLGWIVMSGLMYCSSAEVAGITESDPFLGDIEGVIPMYQAHKPVISTSLELFSKDADNLHYNLPVDERGNFGMPALQPGIYTLQMKTVVEDNISIFEIRDIHVLGKAITYILTPPLSFLSKVDNVSTLWSRKQVMKADSHKTCHIDIVSHSGDSVGSLYLAHSKGDTHHVDLQDDNDKTGLNPGFYFVTGSLGTLKKAIIPQYGIWITPDSTAIVTLASYQPTIIDEMVPPRKWEDHYKH